MRNKHKELSDTAVSDKLESTNLDEDVLSCSLVWRVWGAFAALENHKRYFLREFVKSYNLSENEFKLLALLAWHKSLKQSEIAQLLQMDAGNLSREIDRMEAKELLIRKPCPGDGRTFLVSLGSASKDILGRFDATLLSRIHNFFDDNPGSDLYQLALILESLDEKIREVRVLFERYKRMRGHRA